MKLFATLSLFTALTAPAFSADYVVTKSKHADPVKMRGVDQPAKDSTEVTWIGKDRMRTEEGDSITIVRNDLKKLYLIDSKEKTYKVIDLPVDMKKYLHPDLVPDLEKRLEQIKITVVATTETKKVKEWNATKYTMTMTMPVPKGASFTQDIWVTKDVAIDVHAWNDMSASIMCASPVGGAMAAELKKLDGVPVLVERAQSMYGKEFKGKDEVTLIEQKEPAAGLYDVPKDYTEQPFQPMGDPGEFRGKITPVPPAPGDKPVEKPTEKPVEKPVPH